MLQNTSFKLALSLGENDGDNEAIETEGLTENENEDHADENGFLLSVCTNTSVTNDTNCESSSLFNN